MITRCKCVAKCSESRAECLVRVCTYIIEQYSLNSQVRCVHSPDGGAEMFRQFAATDGKQTDATTAAAATTVVLDCRMNIVRGRCTDAWIQSYCHNQERPWIKQPAQKHTIIALYLRATLKANLLALARSICFPSLPTKANSNTLGTDSLQCLQQKDWVRPYLGSFRLTTTRTISFFILLDTFDIRLTCSSSAGSRGEWSPGALVP